MIIFVSQTLNKNERSINKMNIKKSILYFTLFFVSLGILRGLAQDQHIQMNQQPQQAKSGPGGQSYLTDEWNSLEHYSSPQGYNLYVPILEDDQQEKQVIVFIHGYGALNPMIYGAWLKHLIRKGNIIIYPRYQNKILGTPTDEFAANLQIALHAALDELDSLKVSYDKEGIIYTGHSYGGTMTAFIAARYDSLGLAKPAAVFICEPGTGPFKGGKLDTYEDIDPDIKTLIMVGDKDLTVGQSLGKRIFKTAGQVKDINLVWQYRDKYGSPTVSASHYEPQSLDAVFDNGNYNLTWKRARKTSKTDVVDYNGYWKLLDALITCKNQNTHCETCFGGGEAMTSLGNWLDGKKIKALQVFTEAAQLADQ